VAKIVSQSGSARMTALLGIAVVTLFVLVYAFYDQGLPGVEGSSRMEAAREEIYLDTVKRGYNLYEANCARCHGEQGQGGIGPVLNDQGKLLAHLSPSFSDGRLGRQQWRPVELPRDRRADRMDARHQG
jgi:mono/diheme cytochrome c family protein